MNFSFGAIIFGFIIGGLSLVVQLLVICAFDFLSGEMEMNRDTLGAGILVTGAGFLLIYGIMMWVIWLCVVLPASWIYRLLGMKPVPSSICGAVLGAALGWIILDTPGIAGNISGGVVFSCLSSAVIAGSFVGYILGSSRTKAVASG